MGPLTRRSRSTGLVRALAVAALGPSGGPLGGAGRQLGHVHPIGPPEPRPGDRHFLGQMDRWTRGQAPLKGAAGSPAAHAFGLPKREVGTQLQPGLLCPSPRALRVAWPRAPLLRGRWPPPRLSVAVSTWTTAESARDGPLPGRQACLCPRPLSQGLSGTMAPDLRAFIPDPCTAHMRRHEGLTRQLEPRLGAPECGRRPCLSA